MLPSNPSQSLSASAVVTLSAVTIRAPKGQTLFDNLSLSLGRQRAAVVGRNGVGKSTLFHLIMGEIEPQAGTVTRAGRLGLLRQTYQPQADERLGQTLGQQEPLAVLERILAGEGSEDDLAQADWTLEARLHQAMAHMGLGALDFHQPTASLSGGELTRLRLARLWFEAPDLILMDEPTNHLDEAGRQAVRHMVSQWPGGLAIISHDRDLLRQMDQIIELSPLGARVYGGNYDHYRQQREAERAAADQALDRAERGVAQAERQAQTALERQARRDRAGRVMRAGSSDPKIMLDAQAERAEQSGARNARLAERQKEVAHDRLVQAQGLISRDDPLPMALDDPGLPAGRGVLELSQATWATPDGHDILHAIDLKITGPERIAITGLNGSGKSCLLRLMAGIEAATQGQVHRPVTSAYLDQSVSLLDPDLNLIDNWLAHNPAATGHQAHAALARFGFRNVAGQKMAGQLSGGERLRAGLACVMAGPLPVQLLLLDEPTNHLDLEAIEALQAVLLAYRGAMVVVSHDRDFLEAIGIQREIRLVSGHAVEGDGAAVAGRGAA